MKTFWFTREQECTEYQTVSVQARNQKEALTKAQAGEYEEGGEVGHAYADEVTFTLQEDDDE